MKLKIITTGGTIDKMYPSRKGTKSLKIGDPAIERVLERIPRKINYDLTEVCRIDSLDMNHSHRQEISEVIERTNFENIVITHGTDEISGTARYLQDKNYNKSVVLVGSSRPERFNNSDADINVGGALSALDLMKNEVKVVIHGRVYNPDHVAKKDDGTFTLTE